jgi:hypothetical protein
VKFRPLAGAALGALALLGVGCAAETAPALREVGARLDDLQRDAGRTPWTPQAREELARLGER